jgi:hypothetical protein
MYDREAKSTNISGDIPVNCFKSDKIEGFGSYKRKNSGYFKGNTGISQFNRNFSGYFPVALKLSKT